MSRAVDVHIILRPHAIDGVLVLDIKWRPGEPLKSKAAQRVVPVHSALLDLGFGHYLERVAGGPRLWPGIRRPPGVNTWGQPFSKWFTRARRKAGIYVKGVDYHSLRGTFVTALLNAEVPLERVRTLVGHQAEGITSYSLRARSRS